MEMLFAIRDPVCFCAGLCFCFSMGLFGAIVHYHRKRVEVLFFTFFTWGRGSPDQTDLFS